VDEPKAEQVKKSLPKKATAKSKPPAKKPKQ
jgi:hypothetical protein